MFSNSRYDPHRRRNHRRHPGPPTGQHLLTHITTIAVVAYGAYRVGSWAWNNIFRDDDGNKNDDDDVYATKNSDKDGDEDLLQEWASSENYSSSPMRRSIRAEARRVMARDDERLELNNNSSNGVEYIGDVVVGESSSAVVDDGNNSCNNGQTNNRSGRGHHPSLPQDYQRPQCHPQINDRERTSRMARCRLESSRAMLDFLPTMKGAISKETDVSRETDELKELRAEKREINEMKKQQSVNDEVEAYNNSRLEVIKGREKYLWNSIKNKSLTRIITTVYAHTIIYLTLNVQVNLLGGRLLKDEYGEQHASTSSEEGAANRYRSSHEIVLSKTYHHLFAIGIPSIANAVGKEVTRILQDWDVLNDDVTIQDVSSWLQSVRAGIEHQRRQREEGVSSCALVQFVIGHESEDSDDSTSDELARYILDETYDLLESPTFAIAERDCLDATFDQLNNSLLSTLFGVKDQQIPVVNVVTHMQKTAVLTFHKPLSHRNEASNPNAYIPNLERLDAVQELSNVCF
jgi:peroxin-3